MPKPSPELRNELFDQLRERLLRAGVAPRHVRRYLAELTDHLADLTTQEEHAGRTHPEAEAAALARLGAIDDLAQAMVTQPQLQSSSARAPWAAFGLVPLAVLAAAWCIALLILWTGWQLFLPGAPTPFGAAGRATWLFQPSNICFQIGRSIYFGAPILVGWAIGLAAARQRLKLLWPAAGLLLVALLGSTAQVHASRMGATGGRHVSIGFTLAHFANSSYGLFDALIILTLTALPYLLWRFQKSPSRLA